MEHDGLLCICCGILIANNDDSGCKDYHMHTEKDHPKELWRTREYHLLDKESWIFKALFLQYCCGCGCDLTYGQTVFDVSYVDCS